MLQNLSMNQTIQPTFGGLNQILAFLDQALDGFARSVQLLLMSV